MISLLSIYGAAGAVFAVISLVPYLISIISGRTKPHIFTWILWTLLTFIVWAIQFADGAGAGAWATLVTAILSLVIVVFSFKNGHKNITKTDWGTFIVGLLSIPLWMLTKDPTLSAILVTFIDVVAFYPTLRKSWHFPREELVFLYVISTVKHVFSFMALSNVTIATAVFPVVVSIVNLLAIVMILWRRYAVFKNFKNK